MHIHIVETLTTAHRMMEHVLTLIRLQVDMLQPLTKNEEFVFLRKAVGYMHNYPGLIHHPAEEMISERLKHYLPGAAPLCLKLGEEHKQFNVLETEWLSKDDWLDIGCKSNLDMDPLSNPVILKHYDNLYDYIMSTSLNLGVH